VKRVQIGLQLD
jgi:hypothetical protein